MLDNQTAIQYFRHYLPTVLTINAVVTIVVWWILTNLLEICGAVIENQAVLKASQICSDFGFILFFVFLIPMFLAFKKNPTWPDDLTFISTKQK